MLYVLECFEAELMRIGFHEAVRATCHGIEISMPNFFGIFEPYYPASRSFFTPVSEVGLALHEMWEISNLLLGSMPYEKYFPYTMELEQMEKDNPDMFETYRELMCHFYICMDVHNTRGNANEINVSTDYLFPVLDDAPEKVHFPISDVDINQKMISSAHKDVVLEEDDDIYEKEDKFKSFHR